MPLTRMEGEPRKPMSFASASFATSTSLTSAAIVTLVPLVVILRPLARLTSGASFGSLAAPSWAKFLSISMGSFKPVANCLALSALPAPRVMLNLRSLSRARPPLMLSVLSRIFFASSCLPRSRRRYR